LAIFISPENLLFYQNCACHAALGMLVTFVAFSIYPCLKKAKQKEDKKQPGAA
jgi:hypothetical protein